jgi:ORF6N domain
MHPLNAAWIEARICESRNVRVLLDTDLARIYGVETKRLVEQVKRNQARFPADFAWQLDSREAAALRSPIATSSVGHGGRRYRPWVFTEHGAIMLANVLKSPSAVLASVEVVRAFVRLRGLAAEHRDLAGRLDALEQRYDLRFKAVFDAVRQLLETPRRRRGRIGFGLDDEPPTPDPGHAVR